MDLEKKIEYVRQAIVSQFTNRTTVEGNRQGRDFGIQLHTKVDENSLWLNFTKDGETHSIDIPLPFEENGILFIERNCVRRALCNYYIEEEQNELDFMGVVYRIICGDPTGIVSSFLIKKVSFVQQIIYSFDNNSTANVVYNIGRAINEVLNKMPLHNTDMNSWMMNHRLIIIDPDFEVLSNPRDRLEYQVEKARKYFSKGWTSIGLSDGTLSDYNYILKEDLRKYVPFGLNYHNPQRNLYSTLGMKGDETPLVRSESMQRLMDQGITRTGWNLNTAFVDVPLVWEDQILVDNRHRDKKVSFETRYQCFGKPSIRKGMKVKTGQVISVEPGWKFKYFDHKVDEAVVTEVKESLINVGGQATQVYNVKITGYRKLKEGMKITNNAANKGVIRFANLGHAKNPATGEWEPLDVMVSGRAVEKRRNFGQILEAICNNLTDCEGCVLPDDVVVNDTEGYLKAKGFNEDGTWECETCFGKLKAVTGKVFWGITHDVEDMLWEKKDVTRVNGRDLRTAGLKFSTVEMRALSTRFGKDNPLINEIMSYSQGGEDLHELIRILKSAREERPEDVPTVDVKNINPVDQSKGSIVDEKYLIGTVADENILTKGFMLKLPVDYMIVTRKEEFIGRDKGPIIVEGVPSEIAPELVHEVDKKYVFDSVYVPYAPLRRSWRHDTGKYGLSEVSALINNIVVIAHRHFDEPGVGIHIEMLRRAIHAYLSRVSQKMGSKRGEVSTHGMAVRYPFSAKAVATLSDSLPKNTIEIHRSMADLLEVDTGDVVLVERFPCLGFMSVRPQKIQVTENEDCRYVIRVSKNCLTSMSLDFDGDVLYCASFHTPESKEALRKEWTNPNKSCYDAIKELNKKAGVPHFKEFNLQDYKVHEFEPLTEDSHAEIVKSNTGVKSHTGPVIALAYNIMRIIENSSVRNDQKTNCAIELFLDRVGNSVFKQKHGVKSLHDIVVDAICTCDVDTLVSEGFRRGTSTIVCNVIREKAKKLGITNLVAHHERVKEKGGSNIINLIVRRENKIYFASRAQLDACSLLKHLEAPAVDVPSKMFKWSLSRKSDKIKTPLDEKFEETLARNIKISSIRGAAESLMSAIDSVFGITKESENSLAPAATAPVSCNKPFHGRSRYCKPTQNSRVLEGRKSRNNTKPKAEGTDPKVRSRYCKATMNSTILEGRRKRRICNVSK